MRLSLQEMRAQSTAIVAGDMGEVIEGGSEFDSVIVMTDAAVRGAMPMKVQQALNPMRFRIFTSYAPKRVFGKADRGQYWEGGGGGISVSKLERASATIHMRAHNEVCFLLSRSCLRMCFL